jgi:hypothetical protein
VSEQFILTLRPLAADAPVEVRLRRLLKAALRCYGMECTDIACAPSDASSLQPAAARAVVDDNAKNAADRSEMASECPPATPPPPVRVLRRGAGAEGEASDGNLFTREAPKCRVPSPPLHHRNRQKCWLSPCIQAHHRSECQGDFVKLIDNTYEPGPSMGTGIGGSTKGSGRQSCTTENLAQHAQPQTAGNPAKDEQ